MTFNAGQKQAAQDLDQLVSSTTQLLGAAQTTATISMGASAADLTGTSLTFNTVYANTKIGIWAVYDAAVVTGTPLFIGTCLVDGVLQAGEAHFGGVNAMRGTCAGMWLTTLTSPGSHTIKLQGSGSGTQTFSIHTKWHALVLGP